MKEERTTATILTLLAILTWGGLWGIFEATVGYLLHLFPFSIGWLVWYPVACFFMFNVYRKTHRTEAIVLIGLLSASIKLLNLFSPVRIDKVLNPAVSIVCEALAMAVVIFAVNHFLAQGKRSLLIKGLAVFCMNTGWRLLYALYLLFLVPDWIREVSVISSADALITFFLTHNLFTSLILFGGSVLINHLLRPIKALENKAFVSLSSLSYKFAVCIKIAVAVFLLGSNIALELLI